MLIEIDDGQLLRIAIAIGGEQLVDGPVRQIELVTAEYVQQIQASLFPRFFSPALRAHLRAESAREPLDDSVVLSLLSRPPAQSIHVERPSLLKIQLRSSNVK